MIIMIAIALRETFQFLAQIPRILPIPLHTLSNGSKVCPLLLSSTRELVRNARPSANPSNFQVLSLRSIVSTQQDYQAPDGPDQHRLHQPVTNTNFPFWQFSFNPKYTACKKMKLLTKILPR